MPHRRDNIDFETQVIEWISKDDLRMDALRIASKLNLKDWCIAAGFVRALIWDKLHGYEVPTNLDDFDLIYYDPINVDEEIDRKIEMSLKKISNYPWSVKNQARMHIRNGDKQYLSTSDAMTYWVEVETAIGVYINNVGKLKLVKPFGLEKLFENSITINPKRPKPDDFTSRLHEKKWLEIWPNLRAKY